MIELIQQYWQQYLFGTLARPTGLAITLWLTVASLGLGFILAVPLAVAKASTNWWLSIPVSIYTYVIRGTPLYVQLLFLYTGVYSLDIVHSTPLVNAFFRDAFNCTLLAFVLNTGAYTTEIFSGAIKATPRGEIEAARAFGMSSLTLYRCIILPSALRRALPAYSNEVILMLHATTLAATATVPDLLKVARSAASDYYLPFVAYGIAAILYLCISFALIWLFRRAERRWLAHLR
ncbi:MAG TPA: histidine ABC transporter permease HisM [Chthoniobacterales bacterium]|nr:histidine ABC transporter permease HisM [Chthoniobacterales bacterium]